MNLTFCHDCKNRNKPVGKNINGTQPHELNLLFICRELHSLVSLTLFD